MQLLSRALRCASRSHASQLLSYNQVNRIHRMTPICVQQNFLQNNISSHFELSRHQRPRKSLTFSSSQMLLQSSLHTQNAHYIRNSNVVLELRQRKTDEVKSALDATKAATEANNELLSTGLDESQKLGLFQRFKKMAKDYWYVLIPVHVATSACWLGAFYYTSTSGVDIVGILESYKFSETIIGPLRNSSLGHVAIAYFLYKIATPARYFVTVAGTTMTIKQGMKFGWIKPMPSREEMTQMYKDKKGEMQQKIQDKRDEMNEKYQTRKQAIRDKYMRK